MNVKKMISIAVSVFLGVTLISFQATLELYAAGDDYPLNGRKYEFDEKTNYVISDEVDFKNIDSRRNIDGHVIINGNLKQMVDTNGFPAFNVESGNVNFSYVFGSTAKETAEDKWHIVEDGGKEINGVKLSSSIKNGALIVQTSQDGNVWVNDTNLTNILTDSYKVDSFYTTKSIQLVSGCFYRITVVYEAKKKTGEKKVLFIKNDIYETKKVAEVFEFYLYDESQAMKTNDTAVSTNLGTKTRTEKNDGYYGEQPIDIKDPHYGWDLGTFVVSGYTEETADNNDNPVFLKNVGDQITLSFSLDQDIDKLNNNERLMINPDLSGYDRDFEVKKTNFGRGALIIRKTDYQKKVGKPEIYTNFLEANAKTGANTIVGLFEEGDYEVALDYEIKNTPRQVAGIDVIPEYSDYTMRIKFSIRNSNCMVFPFDVETKDELIDKSITPNGFKLDLARSRYLNINVQKYTVSKGSDGLLIMDERFNRSAKDNEEFTDEGIYLFTVSNVYTGEKTTKTIYVGESQIIKALATSGKSLNEINDILKAGGKIDKDGKVVPKK